MSTVVSHHSLLPYRTIHLPPHFAISHRRFSSSLCSSHLYLATSLAIVLFRGPVQSLSLVCYPAHHHSTLTLCRKAVPTPTSSRPIDSSFSIASSIRRIPSPNLAVFRNVFQRFTPFPNVASRHSDFLIGFRSAPHRGKLSF